MFTGNIALACVRNPNASSTVYKYVWVDAIVYIEMHTYSSTDICAFRVYRFSQNKSKAQKRPLTAPDII